MSVVGFRARNHPQQVASRSTALLPLFEGWGEQEPVNITDSVDDRATPEEVFAVFHERFRFTIDVAASKHNAKLPRYYTREDNGLEATWANERVWCNPPFSNIRPWVENAWNEEGAHLIVMLLPANRTEQGWWQDLVEPHRDRADSILRTEFLRGRPRFIAPGKSGICPNERPPFGCVLLIWDRPAYLPLMDAKTNPDEP